MSTIFQHLLNLSILTSFAFAILVIVHGLAVVAKTMYEAKTLTMTRRDKIIYGVALAYATSYLCLGLIP